jgi:hypothetical protein
VKALDNASAGWWTWPAYFLFFLMLAFPIVHTVLYVKAFLFALLLTFVVTQALTRLHLHPKVVMWTLALAAVSLFFGLRGLFLGAPGAGKSIQVYAMWPLVYLVLLSGINNVRIFRGLQQTLVFSATFIALFGISFFLSQLDIVPQIPHLDLLFSRDELDSGLFLSSGFSDGHVELSFPGLSSYPFLVPFLMAAAVCRPSKTGNGWTSRRWLSLSLVLSLVIVLLSGRRALQLVTMLTPFLILGLGSFQPRKERLALWKSVGRGAVASLAVIVLSIMLLSPVYAITFEGLADRFSAGFDFSASNQSDSSTGRVEQYLALKSGWMEAPLVGRGLGASAHASIRAASQPWAYELSYVALLFQTGLLGFAAYTAGIAWIYWSGIKIIKCGGVGSQFMLPVLVGMSGLLIANGTNPYLDRFDGIWVIFLPLAFINYWLLIHDHAQNPASGRARQLSEQL